ncbi:MAG TPA: rhodanese-like domain-containing protein [Sphingomicrobium sp.]|nr:rhodanese-like domain-containing protein [Sphingomicrobium sp.]
MAHSVQDMLAAANDCVPKISVAEAERLIRDKGALLVDVREAQELASSGKLASALHVSRGMLEFKADSSSPACNPEFRTDRPIILYCASGGRSSLSGKTLRDLGYKDVYNLGGFKDAVAAGFPTEAA